MAGYATKNILDKIGVKPAMQVYLFHSPDTYIREYRKRGDSTIHTSLDEEMDLIHAFFATTFELEENFAMLEQYVKKDGMFWISWPKKTSGMQSDLSETEVRAYGLEHGLVDVKIAAIDAVWSGLKFVYRLRDRKH